MVKLLFLPSALPRTINRFQWREIWRWKRVTERRLEEETARRIENLALSGVSHSSQLDDFVRPPLLVFPAVKNQPVAILPGHVTYVGTLGE